VAWLVQTIPACFAAFLLTYCWETLRTPFNTVGFIHVFTATQIWLASLLDSVFSWPIVSTSWSQINFCSVQFNISFDDLISLKLPLVFLLTGLLLS